MPSQGMGVLTGLSAEQLPKADAGFDTVVCTYTPCSTPYAERPHQPRLATSVKMS